MTDHSCNASRSCRRLTLLQWPKYNRLQKQFHRRSLHNKDDIQSVARFHWIWSPRKMCKCLGNRNSPTSLRNEHCRRWTKWDSSLSLLVAGYDAGRTYGDLGPISQRHRKLISMGRNHILMACRSFSAKTQPFQLSLYFLDRAGYPL